MRPEATSRMVERGNHGGWGAPRPIPRTPFPIPARFARLRLTAAPSSLIIKQGILKNGVKCMSVYFDLLRQWCDALIELSGAATWGRTSTARSSVPPASLRTAAAMDAVYPLHVPGPTAPARKTTTCAAAEVSRRLARPPYDLRRRRRIQRPQLRLARHHGLRGDRACARHWRSHGLPLLSDQTRAAWQNKLSAHVRVALPQHRRAQSKANINYVATNACRAWR